MTNKKRVITTAAAALVLAAVSVSMSRISGSLNSQTMAERWQAGELRYSQISVFFPAGNSSRGFSETESLERSVEEKIKQGSFRPEAEGAQVWTCAYSSVMTPVSAAVTDDLTGKVKSTGAEVNVVCTGGDFFEFHPLELVSGNYIYENELRTDRVVLDENAAWNIFSSTDVTGMTLWLNDTEFEVAGVVKAEDSSSVRKAYSENPVVYAHFGAAEERCFDETLLCWEAVLPNPVSNYARNMMLEYFGINTMTEQEDGKDPERALDVVIKENTGRYSLKELWKGLKDFDRISVSDRSIAYPYWENAARINGVHMEILFFTALVSAVYILVMLLCTAGRLYLNRKWHLKDWLEDMMYKYTYKKRTSDYISLDINESEKRED